MIIKRASEQDAGALTRLAMLSKDHWGYGQEQILDWQDELTVTIDYISTHHVRQLIKSDRLVGFYAFSVGQNVIALDFFFVHPDYIGKGNGKALMSHFLSNVERSKFKRIRVYADPHAEGFYKSFGFVTVAKHKSSIKGRFLPVMELALQ